jgi:hypothetical protein
LDQIFNSPVSADAREEADQSKKDRKDQWTFKKEAIIENISQFSEPLDINSEGKEKRDQGRHWNEIEEIKSESLCPSTFSFKGEDKSEVEKEQGSKDQSYKDHLHPKDGMNWIDAADHDEFAHIPCGERKDKACKEPVSDIFEVAGKDDQTEGEVYREGKCSRKRQDIHRSTLPSTPLTLPTRRLPLSPQTL